MNLQNIDLTGKKALLIDCDNTLAETMTSHDKAYELAFLLNSVPFDISEHKKWAPLGGTILMQETVINKGYGHLVDNIIRDKQSLLPICLRKLMKANTKLIQLIKQRDENLLVFIVSNGRKNSIMQVLNELGITYHIDGLIAKEDVEKAKPNPDPYLFAMKLANLKPEEVIVFEDNKVGIDAAKAAGVVDIIQVDPTKF